MADNEKKITPEEVQDIFARQLKRFELTEEEQARAEKLGLNDIDLSEIDLSEEKMPFEVVDSLSLEECAQLNDGSGYYDKVVCNDFTKYELAGFCLEKLYEHIETGEISQQMMDINEKLLCFAENEELINAITCMGLQLSKYNQTQGEKDDVTNQPGTTGKMMNFHDSMATILSMLKEQDKDIQTTVANEIPLIEKESYIVENLMYIYSGILERVSSADKSACEDNELYKPELAEIATDIVKTQYEFISDIYSKAFETVKNFISDCLDDELTLDESGRYDPELSVFRLAKHVAFDDVDYALPGDEDRMVVLDIPATQIKQIPVFDKDIYADTVSFYEKADKITDEYKRQCLIFSCEKNIRSAKDKSFDKKYKQDYYQIRYAERLLALDNKNEHFMPLYNQLSLDKLYRDANANNTFHRDYDYFDLGTSLFHANLAKEKYPNGPGLVSVSSKMKLAFVVCAVLAVLALLIPSALIETGFETVMKAIFGIIAVVRVIFTGPVALFVAPIAMLFFYFCFMFVLAIVQAFISPVLFIKLVLIGIPGAFAIYLYSEIANEIRKSRSYYKDVTEARTQYKPIAEKLLAICKERNMSPEMITYYERLVEEFKKL